MSCAHGPAPIRVINLCFLRESSSDRGPMDLAGELIHSSIRLLSVVRVRRSFVQGGIIIVEEATVALYAPMIMNSYVMFWNH